MQSRFELRADAAMLSQWSGVHITDAAAAPPRRTVYDHEHYPVLRRSPVSHSPELVWMREGLVPSYAHDDQDAEKRAEAHVESLTCESCFRAAFRRRRCLIPAQLLQEPGRGSKRQEGCSFALASGDVFSIAAIWETWCNDQGHSVETFAIVTTRVTPLLRPILDRMPVIIAPEARDRWLEVDAHGNAPMDLLRPLDNAELARWKLMPQGVQV